MILTGMTAGGKGVEPSDLVRKTLIHKKLQRAIGHGRLLAEALGSQPVQYLIGTKRAMFPQQDLQCGATDRGQANPTFGQDRLGPGQALIGAGLVVMLCKGGVAGRGCGTIRHEGSLTCYDITA